MSGFFGSLGTVATQNASAVAITGGTIGGMTSIAAGAATPPNAKIQSSADLTSNPTTGTYGQIEATGGTLKTKRMVLAFNTAENQGVIQALENGEAFRDIQVNPQGGNVGVGLATTPPGALLDVGGSLRCDSLRIDAAAVAETPVYTHTITINANGTSIKLHGSLA